MGAIYIYGLQDPLTQQLRYVGKTRRDLNYRLSCHLANKTTSHLGYWIRSLLRQGLQPEIFEIERTTEESWQEDERFWIAYFRYIGANLTNVALGGEGADAVSQSTRLNMSMAQRGRPHSPEHSAAIGAAHRGKTISQEARAKMSLAKMGEHSPTAKLTPERVLEIRRRYRKGKHGLSSPALAKEYGVDNTTILKIVKGISWTNTK